VLLYHFFPNAVPGGYVGVDVFFVISGYLITRIIVTDIQTDQFSLLHFMARRIRRLFPALLIVMTFTLFAGYLVLSPDDYKKLSLNAVGGLGFFANFTQYSEAGYFAAGPENRPLFHLWSLSVEEQFYFLWPSLLVIIWKLFAKFKDRKLVFLLAAILFMSFSFFCNLLWIKIAPDWVFYMPFTRVWEMLLGSVLTLGWASHKTATRFRHLVSFGALLVILVFAFVLNKNSIYPGINALIPTLAAALVIWAGPGAKTNALLLSNRLLVWIGLVSYPLFLWHWPLLSFAYFIFGPTLSLVLKLAVLSTSILLSWVTYFFIESALRKSHNKLVIPTLLAVNSVLLIFSSAVYIKNGLPNRVNYLPVELQEMAGAQFSEQIDMFWRPGLCFLSKNQDSAQFSTSCTSDLYKNKIFLWGDSHAAALYPGLRSFVANQGIPYDIAQYTSSLCPPLLNFYAENVHRSCKQINDYNLKLIEKMRPDIVILSAAWYSESYDLANLSLNLAQTVRALKALNIKRIILIGPVPTWKKDVPKVIVDYYKRFKDLPQNRSNYLLNENLSSIDFKMAAIAKELSVSYISIYDTLCTLDGCFLRFGDSPTDVSSFDAGHLSPAAAKHVFNVMGVKIFRSE